jgi:hypothetical protein
MPDQIKHPAESTETDGTQDVAAIIGAQNSASPTESGGRHRSRRAAWGHKTQTVEARVATDLIDTGPACAVLTRKAACRFPS